MHKLTKEHIDVLERAEALGLDTMGYNTPRSKWPKLEARVKAAEAARARFEKRVLSPENTVPSSDPTLDPRKPVEGTRQRSEAMRIRERERELRPALLLEAQKWRCAYACDGNGKGRPLLPGEPFAYIDDHNGIVHLECMKAGEVPTEGNPWTTDGGFHGGK